MLKYACNCRRWALEASVLVGERTIVIAKKGYSASTEVINIEKGKKKILRRSLAPEMGGIEVSLAGVPYLFEPGRAKVFLDGRYRGNMPEEGKSLKIANILAGEHIVRVEHPDYEVKEASVLVRHNVTEDVRIELKGKPGKVVVVTTPLGAEVEIDGKKVGVTPFNTALEPGRHRISISLKGYKTEIKEIDVTPNKPLTLNISLSAVSHTRRTRPVLLWSYETGDKVWSSPSLGDIDGDGRLEVVVGSVDYKIYALSTGAPVPSPSLLPWPKFKHDAKNTGLRTGTPNPPW